MASPHSQKDSSCQHLHILHRPKLCSTLHTSTPGNNTDFTNSSNSLTKVALLTFPTAALHFLSQSLGAFAVALPLSSTILTLVRYSLNTLHRYTCTPPPLLPPYHQHKTSLCIHHPGVQISYTPPKMIPYAPHVSACSWGACSRCQGMPTNVTNERQTETHTAVKLVLAYIA